MNPLLRSLGSADQPRVVMVDLRGMEPSGSNGGLQTYVEWLLPWLVTHRRDDFAFLALAGLHNHELVASLLGAGDAVCIQAGYNMIWRAGGELPAVASTSLSPQAIARRLAVDALYAPLGALPFAEPGLHSIALIADMLHRELPESLTPEIIAHRDRYIPFTVQNATLLQCISQSGQERLEHHFPESKGKTFFTYLPIQSRLQQAGSGEDQAAIPRKPYFFYPANFWPHKNHRHLISAFDRYVREAGDAAWDLVLCGGDYGGNQQSIQDLAESLGLGQRVHLPGYVNEATLAALWRRASALVFPSLHEGFGIPLLEAMAAGLPVLSANGYSLPEVAGDAALYFDPRDPSQMAARMLEVTCDESLRKSLIAQGRQRLQFFNADTEGVKVAEALLGNLQS